MNIGDKVTWTHVVQRGKTVTLTLRTGVIESITGDMAVVKRQNGRTENIPLRRLRLPGQESQIREFIEAMRGKL